jgi:1-acyl-sn-glycerol-3-phosphate acyltransferase
MMAINAGVPIVPMICTGAHKIMEKRSLVIHPGEIEVEFLDPIDSTIYSLAERDILNEQVHKAMTAALPPDQRPISFLEAMPAASPNNEQTESADANRKENV